MRASERPLDKADACSFTIAAYNKHSDEANEYVTEQTLIIRRPV